VSLAVPLSASPEASTAPAGIAGRVEALYEGDLAKGYRETDQMFAVLLLLQWVFALVVALVVSPYSWAGTAYTLHIHVVVALVGGLVINSLPIALVLTMPGSFATRCAISVAQVLWSALLIHLTGGRIETHFHVFGSLAFIAFYRDWRVLIPATVVVATDHVLRQFLYPESVYGIPNPEWWRFLEHAGWVAFEDVVLVYACLRSTQELHEISARQAQVEALSASETAKSVALDAALHELRRSQETLVRSEKLAAVGQLAASVGHELRNPLAAVQNAHAYLGKRVAKSELAQDARVTQFVGLIDSELAACNRIIGDLLDFARDRPPSRGPCPLRALGDDAIAVVPKHAHVAVANEIAELMPVPTLDRDQFRQVLANLVQNAIEAIPSDRTGRVRLQADGDGTAGWRIRVVDDGPGMEKDVVDRVFQPLFTTKTKGTGLGLAIVSNIVKSHGGTIQVQTEPGRGTTFTIALPGAQA
jgi:two-component system sensor histidine kinase HydH